MAEQPKYAYGDIVRLLDYPERDVNGYGVVQGPSIFEGHWLVSNMNMPFVGSLCKARIHESRIKLRSKRT